MSGWMDDFYWAEARVAQFDDCRAALRAMPAGTIRIRLPADHKPTGTPMPDIEPQPARKDFDLFVILEGAMYCAAHDENHTALVALSQEYRALIRDNEDWLKNA